MICKKRSYLPHLIQIYVLFSVLATILLFIHRDVSLAFYTIGASSGYIAFGIATSESINLIAPFALILMLWAIILPIALLIAFVKCLKKKYKSMCVLMVADTIIVVFWVLFASIAGNIYGTQVFFFDALISMLFSVVVLWQARIRKTEL